jgi:hypothetical protein
MTILRARREVPGMVGMAEFEASHSLPTAAFPSTSLQCMLTSPAYEGYHVVISSNIPANSLVGSKEHVMDEGAL